MTPKVRQTVPSEINPGESHVIFVDPKEVQSYAAAKAEREAATLKRDREENLAAARATARDFGLADPLADLRE